MEVSLHYPNTTTTEAHPGEVLALMGEHNKKWLGVKLYVCG
jgi:hypothetical protein